MGTKVIANPDDVAEDVLHKVEIDGEIYSVPSGGGGGGTSDYLELDNKPQINGVELSGNKTTGDLGIKFEDLPDAPTLGTASSKDVPASGDASSSQVVMGNDSRLSDSRPASDVSSWAKQATKPSYTANEVGAIPSTDKGANGGVATLGNDGVVPSSQLPAMFDGDYNSLTNKPTLGTASAKDVPTSGNASLTEVVLGSDSRLSDDRNAKDVYPWAKAATKPTYTATEVGAIPSTDKGANGGVAELDSNGLVPASQLPSYVDDVLEGTAQNVTETGAGTYSATGFILSGESSPCVPESGKTYVDTTSNIQYRWTGTGTNFVSMGSNLALGETSSTAYRGDRGKTAYDHSQTTGNPHGTTASDVGLGNVPNVSTNDQEPTFTEASTRNNIASGEKLSVILGKIQKFFNDLKTVAFSGSFSDLSNKPENANTFQGTIAEWNQLSTAEKKAYDHASITGTGGGEYNVDKSTGDLVQTSGMPSEYPATQVMLSDGVTSVEDATNSTQSLINTIKETRFNITHISGNQTSFTGYGIYNSYTKTVRIYINSSGSSAVTSENVGQIPDGYRPSVNKAIGGIVNGSPCNCYVKADGKVSQAQSSSYTTAFIVGEYIL